MKGCMTSGQGVMDDSANIQEIISTYRNFDILCFLLQMCQIIQKLCCVQNSYRPIDYTRDCKEDGG